MQTLLYSLLNISAKYHQNLCNIISSYTVSKLGRFLRHSVVWFCKYIPLSVLQYIQYIQFLCLCSVYILRIFHDLEWWWH